MGMYDEVVCSHALPDGWNPAGHVFQTKDTDCDLDRYVLEVDGRLTLDGEPIPFHGALNFYTSNWGGCGMGLEMTSDDTPPWRADYTALYDNGKLVRIDATPGYALEDPTGHVPRADFHRLTEERRAATAKPGEDLAREWVHWMNCFQDGRTQFERVQPPALQVRLAYLRSQMAWCFEGFGDTADPIRDLRNWSGWLAAEPRPLPKDAAKLLQRTLGFLGAFALPGTGVVQPAPDPLP